MTLRAFPACAILALAACATGGPAPDLPPAETFDDRAAAYIALQSATFVADPNPILPTRDSAEYTGLAGLNIAADTRRFDALAEARIAVDFGAGVVEGRIDGFVAADASTLPGALDLVEGTVAGPNMFFDVSGAITVEGTDYDFAGPGGTGSFAGGGAEHAVLTLTASGQSTSGVPATIDGSAYLARE